MGGGRPRRYPHRAPRPGRRPDAPRCSRSAHVASLAGSATARNQSPRPIALHLRLFSADNQAGRTQAHSATRSTLLARRGQSPRLGASLLIMSYGNVNRRYRGVTNYIDITTDWRCNSQAHGSGTVLGLDCMASWRWRPILRKSPPLFSVTCATCCATLRESVKVSRRRADGAALYTREGYGAGDGAADST